MSDILYLTGTLWVEEKYQYPDSEITVCESIDGEGISIEGTDDEISHRQRSRMSIDIKKSDLPELIAFLQQFVPQGGAQ